MLKLNAFFKKKKVDFPSKEINLKVIEYVQNDSIFTVEIFISSLINKIEVGSKLD